MRSWHWDIFSHQAGTVVQNYDCQQSFCTAVSHNTSLTILLKLYMKSNLKEEMERPLYAYRVWPRLVQGKGSTTHVCAQAPAYCSYSLRRPIYYGNSLCQRPGKGHLDNGPVIWRHRNSRSFTATHKPRRFLQEEFWVSSLEGIELAVKHLSSAWRIKAAILRKPTWE